MKPNPNIVNFLQAYETLAKLDSQTGSKDLSNKYIDYHYEASEYEKKLIQVPTVCNCLKFLVFAMINDDKLLNLISA